MLLAHALPTSGPLFAVLADEAGLPIFYPVLTLGILESPQTRVVCGMIADTQHIEPADRLPNHVGYAVTNDPEPWLAKCAERRAGLIKAEEDKKGKPQIVVPSREIRPWDH